VDLVVFGAAESARPSARGQYMVRKVAVLTSSGMVLSIDHGNVEFRLDMVHVLLSEWIALHEAIFMKHPTDMPSAQTATARAVIELHDGEWSKVYRCASVVWPLVETSVDAVLPRGWLTL
jgi:hypothetical protein